MVKGLMDIHALAFDLDGTLVDSVGDLADAANAMRHELGMERLPENVLLSFIGDGIGRLVHRALTNDHQSFADTALWEKGFALYVRYYAAHLTDRTRPYPQVKETLALLKTLGLPLAVVTNKSERFARAILDKLELANEFSLLIGGDTLAEKKPSALPLLHVCEAFGIAPGNLLMVGDSGNDILAAHAAGTKVIGVDFGYGDMMALQTAQETCPDEIVSEFIQIYHLLQHTQAST